MLGFYNQLYLCILHFLEKFMLKKMDIIYLRLRDKSPSFSLKKSLDVVTMKLLNNVSLFWKEGARFYNKPKIKPARVE